MGFNYDLRDLRCLFVIQQLKKMTIFCENFTMSIVLYKTDQIMENIKINGLFVELSILVKYTQIQV